MKATVSNVQQITIMLNRDEAISVARILKQFKARNTLASPEQKLCADIIENIKQGMEIQV
jgi:hypothetical protein